MTVVGQQVRHRCSALTDLGRRASGRLVRAVVSQTQLNIYCSFLKYFCPTEAVKNLDDMQRSQEVIFKPLPLNEVLWTVEPTNMRIRAGFAELCFALCSTQSVGQVYIQNVLAEGKNRVLVLLRFRKCSDRGTEDQYPSRLQVVVNDKRQELPKTLGGLQCKRQPIDITASVDFRRGFNNKVKLTWQPDCDYAILICVVRRADPETLLQRLRDTSTRSISESKALLRAMLSNESGADVMSKSMKVSLLCPIGRGRISVPVRPKTCNHIQCFDALQFLRLNESNSTWKCPLCSKLFDFDSLAIDGLFAHILSSTDSDEVIFKQDGSWDLVSANVQIHDLCTPQKPALKQRSTTTTRKLSIVDLTGETTDDEENPYTLMPFKSNCCNNNGVSCFMK